MIDKRFFTKNDSFRDIPFLAKGPSTTRNEHDMSKR
jgi:hypothetical protein